MGRLDYAPTTTDSSAQVNTWLIVAGIILALILFMRRNMKQGNLPFWKLASQHPNAAFDWFVSEDCWVVVTPGESAPGPEYTGPFRLSIPKLGGQVIKVYGRETEIDDSQRRFAQHYVESSTP